MEVVEEAIEEVKRGEPALLPLNLVLKEQENVVFVEWKVSKLLLIMRCRKDQLLEKSYYTETIMSTDGYNNDRSIT